MHGRFIYLLIAILLFCSALHAQLNGTYTIGGTSPDYPDMISAVSALQSSGISGAVIFNIRDGYYPGKIIIGNVAGASPSNTITFQSENNNRALVTVTDTSSVSGASNYTLFINGTDYLTIRNITIERSGINPYSTVVYIGSASKRINFSGNRLVSGINTVQSVNSCLIYVPLGGSQDSLALFSDNIFEGAAYGLYFNGLGPANPYPLPSVSGNQFTDQGYNAVFINYAAEPVLTGNLISSQSTNAGFSGIYLSNISSRQIISGNKISGISVGGIGILISNCSSAAGNEGIICNNFIEAHGTGSVSGIDIVSSARQLILHNSVSITTAGPASSCFQLDGTSAEISSFNNILSNSGGGLTEKIISSSTSALVASDHNDLYAPASPVFAIWDTAQAMTFSAWQSISGHDAASVSGDPYFITASDLHASSTALNDNGIATIVTADIDSEPRNPLTPDIGADEFTPLADDIGIEKIISPAGGCGDSATGIAVIVRNYGLVPHSAFTVTAETAGDIIQSFTEIYPDTLSVNEEDTIFFNPAFNTYSGSAITVTAFTALGNDLNHSNDSLQQDFIFSGHPADPLVHSPQFVCQGNAALTAAQDSGDVLEWFRDMQSFIPLYTGDTFLFPVNGDTTLFVEAHHGSGSGGCLRISEIETNGIGDYIEIQNLSPAGIDATGYKVVVSDSYTDINIANVTTWDLGFFNPHGISYRTDDVTDNYFGTNILWNPASNGWAMIIDPRGNLVDMAVMDWDSAIIRSMVVQVGNYTIVPGSEWSGAGINTTCPSTGISNQRTGSEDHNTAGDFDCETDTKGVQNLSMSSSFSGCGTGECASTRIPVDVRLFNGADGLLGADTALTLPFQLKLSPGPGYDSYLWSTGETSDTITITGDGTYWVTVTGGAGGCPGTDTIHVYLRVGLNGMPEENGFSLYPDPAKDFITMSSGKINMQTCSFVIFDAQGRRVRNIPFTRKSVGEISIELTDFENGIYLLQLADNGAILTCKFAVMK